MPSLLNPLFLPLIRSLPVAEHSFEVDAAFWQPKFTAANQAALWGVIFAGMPSTRISRNRLLTFAYPTPEQKCAEILLWGYPSDQRGRVSQLLPNLAQVTAAANTPIAWPNYFAQFNPIPGIGISTVTKLAYFHGLTFQTHPALILDMQLITNVQRWNQVQMPRLNYNNAPHQYIAYLQTMRNAALQVGCTEEQMELFLFTFGDTLG
jgi:hypothetical protein